jgi:hypothetical protein
LPVLEQLGKVGTAALEIQIATLVAVVADLVVLV